MSRQLEIYLHQDYVGALQQSESGALSFSYDEAYVAKEGLALSMSLPLRRAIYQGNCVKAFFSGLLPDEDARRRLAKFLQISEKNPFALLRVIGGEWCRGFIIISTGSIAACSHNA